MQAFKQIRRYLRYREGPSKLLDAGGRRSGKTFGTVTGFLPSFFTEPVQFAFGAVTKKRTSGGWGEIVRYCKGVQKQFGKAGWRFAPAEDGILEAPNAGSWHRLEFISPDAGRGETYDGAIVDELQLTKSDVVNNFLPTLATTMGFFAGLCTAPKTISEWEESSWWINIAMMEEKERLEKHPDWMVLHHPTQPSDIAFAMRQHDLTLKRVPMSDWKYTELATKTLMELRHNMGEARWMREMEVVLVEPKGGRIFPHMNAEHIGEFGYDKELGGELLVGFDQGSGEAYSIGLLCQKYERKTQYEWKEELVSESIYRIFAEIATTEQISSKQMLHKIIRALPGIEVTFLPDPNANQFAREAKELGFIVVDSKVPVHDGNEYVDEMFRKKRVEIDKSCEVLIRQARRYSVKANGEPEDKQADGPDCIRYLIYNDASRSGDIDLEDVLIEEDMEERFGQDSVGAVGLLSLR